MRQSQVKLLAISIQCHRALLSIPELQQPSQQVEIPVNESPCLAQRLLNSQQAAVAREARGHGHIRKDGADLRRHSAQVLKRAQGIAAAGDRPSSDAVIEQPLDKPRMGARVRYYILSSILLYFFNDASMLGRDPDPRCLPREKYFRFDADPGHLAMYVGFRI